MANFVSQVKLPNNTTYIIRDPNARTLDNNDFDTINVTELNAGDLIVTGVGRFTNGLYGNLIGNADTATNAIKATQDESGNNIKSTYASAISISDHTITLKNKNGTSLGTVTVPDNNTTYTVDTGTANGKIKVTPSSGNAYEVSVYGLKSAAYKDVVDTYSETGTNPVSGKAVKAAIDGLPSPMVFRGTVGTSGTVTNVPTDGSAVVGDTYKVITDGTYGGKVAKNGDTLICLTKTSSANTWEIVPSGDEPSGTVTSVAVTNGGGLSVSGSPITSSGTITISHADTSSQASVNNSGRTYIQDITLDTYGHVTGITSATETVVNTDRYVNSAAFADATSADSNNPVKMTLTRAGSDTASVTAYIPKVSSSSAGVVPKGAAVSSQSQSTKFLREDGTWAAPSYTTNTNTTYTLGTSGNSVTLTPSSGSAQSITVPYATSAGTATDNTKLPLAGGTMTGQIVLASNGYRTYNAAGYSVDQHGNFTHLGTTTSDYWHLDSNNGTKKFSVYWETGDVTAAGTITASKFIGVSEADLQWGGKNFSGSYGCIDACLMDELGANRFQFIKADAITVEYSRDAGTTWTDYGASNAQKQQIFAQGGGLVIGKADSTHKATEHPGEYQLRITIDTGIANVYSYLNKFVIYVSTNNSGDCSCKIQKALQSTPTTFIDHTDWVSVTGWSGYNVINTSNLVTYGNTPSSQYGRVRFIFKDSTSTGTSYNGLTVYQIKAFGGIGWSTPSTMAKTGHLYAINENQDATFPANVTATKFIGALQGNADTATTANTATTATNLSGFTNTTTTATAINDATQNGHVYVTGTSDIYGYSDGAAFVQAYSTAWVAQIYQDYRTGQIALRGKNNGTWQDWRKVWDSVNLTSKTAAASGTDLSLVTTGEKAVWNAKPSTDTKNTAGSTDTSSKIYLIGATSQAANPQTYSDDQVYVTNGTLQANNVSASVNVTGVTLGVATTSGTTGGICLYGGATSTTSYGIAMRTTANSGKHGYVQGDWGTYFYMAGATNRGWVFCNAGVGNRTSISCEGHIVTNGSLTLGGNATNTSGVRQVYNSTTKSLDFIFVA